MSKNMDEYLTSKDIRTVAKAARELDKEELLAGQISTAEFKAKISRSDKEIFMERNHYDRGGK